MILSFFLAVGLAATARAITPLSGASSGPAIPNVLPNTYIVELDNIKSLRRDVATPHQQLYRRLEERGVAFTVRKEFVSDPFTGVSLILNNDQDKKFVSSISGIKSFQPVHLWDPPTPVDQHVLTSPSDPRNPPDGESTHKMTGVDKLHALGILGKGVLVGIIDTGVDYTHPALGNGFGRGHKVALGYDFVGDAYNGHNTPVPDSDPLDQCNGHGTHVAGIIAANPSNPYNISGVAYEATLAAYRVFGCKGVVPSDILIEALLKAYKDGCDVITLSLGSPAGWTEYIGGVVASRIADAGRIVTIAAGNEGSEGAWYASSPATGISVISVASVENSALSMQSGITSTGYGPIQYNSLQPYPLPSPFKYDTYYPTYALSKDTGVANDGCGPLPDSTPDLSGKIVIVRRGGCAFVQKLQNIAAKGGNMSFIYDNIVEAPIPITVSPYNGFLISATDGAYLVNQFAAGNNVQVKIPSTGGGVTVADPSGGLINAFSSWGPSNDMYFKPAVAAPGGNIVSTYPVPLGSYAVLSGTSMATPFVAGSAALLLQKNGRSPDVARLARTLFETTALAIPRDKSGDSPLHSLAQAGAGLINVYNALTLRTTLSPGELLLNDTAHFHRVHRLTLHNNGRKQQSYSLEHHPAATANTIGSDGIQPLRTPAQTTDYASVRISPSQVTLHPGESARIVITIDPPNTGNKAAFPVFSGFIQATGSLGENVHTSYLGLNAKTTDLVVIDNTDRYFGNVIPALLDKGSVQAPGTSYTLKGDDVPTLVYRLASGSPAVYFDLVSINTTFVPTDRATRRRRRRSSPENDVFKRDWWLPGGFRHGHGGGGGGTFSKVPTIGPISVLKYQVRNSNDTFENGGYSRFNFSTFANGTTFPKGGYKLLMRALKIAGDAESESSYESWLSTPFRVV